MFNLINAIIIMLVLQYDVSKLTKNSEKCAISKLDQESSACLGSRGFEHITCLQAHFICQGSLGLPCPWGQFNLKKPFADENL
jgi:hypothetical protein